MKTPGDQSSEGRVNTRELEPVWDHSKLCCSAIWLCFFILRAFAERGETGERRCQRADVNSYSEQASVSVNAQALCGCDPDRQSSAALLSLRIFPSTAGRMRKRAAWPVWDHPKPCTAIWPCFFILQTLAERGKTGERSCQRAEKSETHTLNEHLSR